MKLSKLWDLKSFLQENGIKQKFFAKELGVTEQTMCNWMKRKSTPTPLTQKRIEKYIENYYEAKYPTYYSWCCDAEANDVTRSQNNSNETEGTCTKCWQFGLISPKKKENTNAS